MFPLVINCHKLVNEDIQPGYVQLNSVTEGPLGATYKLAFSAELLVDQEDIDMAMVECGLDPQTIEAENKYPSMASLLEALQDHELARSLYDRMIKYGMYDVLDKITKEDFRAFLHFLREQGAMEVMTKIRRPDHWTNINSDPTRGEIGKEYTDLRAGKGGRGSESYKQQHMREVWNYLIEISKTELIEQVKMLFTSMPDEWQAIIFGENDSNIIVQAYKGNEKFGSEEEYEKGARRPEVDVGIKSTQDYKDSWHYPYRKYEEEQHGGPAYLWETDRLNRLANIIFNMINTPKWKQKAARNPEAAKRQIERYKEIRTKAEDARQQLEEGNKRAIYAYVTIDLESLIEVIGAKFIEHVGRQEDDNQYAQATHAGQEIQIWPSGLSGYKEFMYTMAYISQDHKLKNDLLEVINVGMGTDEQIGEEESGQVVGDIDNEGNVYYREYGSGIHQPRSRVELPGEEELENMRYDLFGKEPKRFSKQEKLDQAALRDAKAKLERGEFDESVIAGIAKQIF